MPHQSQIIGGDADEDYTQIVGEYTVKLLGGYIPLVFAPLILTHHLQNTQTFENQKAKCCIMYRLHHQISQNYSRYRYFFQDSKAGII